MRSFSKKDDKVKIKNIYILKRNYNGYYQKIRKLEILEIKLEAKKELISMKKASYLPLCIYYCEVK